MGTTYHNPVLLETSVDGLNIVGNGVYVDVTFGGGGHSREILRQLGPQGKLFAFDHDEDARKNEIDDERFTLIPENFRYMGRFLRFYGIRQVNGILADFGVSSHQFDQAERGFSTRFEGRLDMRMNRNDSLSAYEVVNQYSIEDLTAILFNYGELKSAKAMAAHIVDYRAGKRIETTGQLREALRRFLSKGREQKLLAQVYQAIRIEVNRELDAIKEFLPQTTEVLKKGGRLSLISYHSLEDRLVKRFIRWGKFEGEPERDLYGNYSVPLKSVGKLIVPSQEEIEINNRARSAKLRIAEKL